MDEIKYLTKEEIAASAKGLTKEQTWSVLEQKMAEGYAIEGINDDISPMEAVWGFPKSAMILGKNIGRALLRPDMTMEGIGTMMSAALPESMTEFDERTLPKGDFPGAVAMREKMQARRPREMANEFFREWGRELGIAKDREGNVEWNPNLFFYHLQKDPLAFMSNLAMFFQGGGAAIKLASKGARVAGMSKTAARLSKAAPKVTMIGNVGEPTMVGLNMAKGVRDLMHYTSVELSKATGMNKYIKRMASRKLQLSATGGNETILTTLSRRVGAKGTVFEVNKPVGEYWAKMGVWGTPEQMADQFETLARLSKDVIDQELGKFTQRYKMSTVDDITKKLLDVMGDPDVRKSAQHKKIYNELLELRRKHYGTVDKVKVVGKGGKTKRVKKHTPGDGLTLSEMNKLKRAIDEIDSPYGSTVHVEGIGKVGFVGDSMKAKDLANLRGELQGFIEKRAELNGFKKVKELNRSTILGVESEKIFRDIHLGMKGKRSVLDSFIALTGAASLAFQQWNYAFAAAGVLGVRSYLQSPKFRSAFANHLMYNFTDERIMKLGDEAARGRKLSHSSRMAIRKAIKDLQPLFPELRLAGMAGGASGEY
ncbi:MAG: hypothetical protein KKF27_20145 [Gammaproteobacteria bacterium]|nr:hypothetical protein [Gammaproteobacteria bacterium]